MYIRTSSLATRVPNDRRAYGDEFEHKCCELIVLGRSFGFQHPDSRTVLHQLLHLATDDQARMEILDRSLAHLGASLRSQQIAGGTEFVLRPSR